MSPVANAHLGRSVMPRAVSVCAHPSVWSPTSLCAAATAPLTTASASCTCGPAKNRWTSEWSARENAVSDACAAAALPTYLQCVVRVVSQLPGKNRMDVNLRLNNGTSWIECIEWITKRDGCRSSEKSCCDGGEDCIVISEGSLPSLLIPFQKSILWWVNLPKTALSVATFPGNDLSRIYQALCFLLNAETCGGIVCAWGARCVRNKCECPQCSGEAFSAVCGSDGATYSSECELRTASCVQKRRIDVVKHGSCDEGTKQAVEIA